MPAEDESPEFCAAGDGVELTGSCGEELLELRSSFESFPLRCELLRTLGSFDLLPVVCFPSSLFDLFDSVGLWLLPAAFKTEVSVLSFEMLSLEFEDAFRTYGSVEEEDEILRGVLFAVFKLFVVC